MTCPCSSRRGTTAVDPPWYRLTGASSTHAPESLVELQSLLRRWSANSNGEWWGKLYVASTIWYDTGESAFLQNGCSPNYRGGLWTLACCKHDMRAASSFKERVRSELSAVVILTLAKASGPGHQQYLVSAAKVTGWFETMNDYANELLELRSEKLLGEKMSNRRQSSSLARRFGDCYADGRGRVNDPKVPHVHAGNAGRDLDGTHLLLASDCYVVWNNPILRARSTLGRNRYGINIAPENLLSLLTTA